MGAQNSTQEIIAQNYIDNGKPVSEVGNVNELKMEQGYGNIDHARLVELLQALQRITRLRREATSASVDARQKRRAAFFKRQDVWIYDAKFMGEIQRLRSQGKFEGFEELLTLADLCQNARDGLGPLEQEGTEAEQTWEGHTWKLQQAEEEVYSDFEYEFRVADSYPSAPESVASSQFEPTSEPDSQPLDGKLEVPSAIPYHRIASIASSSSFIFEPDRGERVNQSGDPTLQRSMLLGLDLPSGSYISNSNSGIPDIDYHVDTWSPGDFVDLPQPFPKPSIDLYPQLLSDFVSSRDRINKWLENTLLLSHIEGTSLFTILKDKLDSENIKMPSNWSQLVVAFWELDGAAISQNRQLESIASGQHTEVPKPSLAPGCGAAKSRDRDSISFTPLRPAPSPPPCQPHSSPNTQFRGLREAD